MYTVAVGQSFLKLYNDRMGANLSPKAFFNEVMWPVFFNSEDMKHLMHVTNSDFFQGYKSQAEKAGVELPLYRKQIFNEKLELISQSTTTKKEFEQPSSNFQYIDPSKPIDISGAIAVGFWAGEPHKAKEGQQVSDLEQTPSVEDIYCSWIGAGLAVGMGGGYDFAIDHPAVLWHLFLGWPYYRKLIEQTPGLKGRQISAWNGLWLTYGELGNENPKEIWFKAYEKILPYIKDGKPKSLERPDWPEQVLALCKAEPLRGLNDLVCTGFSMGQKNSSVGTLVIAIPEVQDLDEMWEYLLNLNSELYSDDQALLIEKCMKIEYSMERAIQTGGLGIHALKPKDIDKLLAAQTKKQPKSSIEKIEALATKQKSLFLYNLSWILTMAQTTLPNNEELLKTAEEFAQELRSYFERGSDRSSNVAEKSENIKQLYEATNKISFLNQLSTIVHDRLDKPTEIYDHIKQMVTLLPVDHFRLFQAVLKCTYVYCKLGGVLTNRFQANY